MTEPQMHWPDLIEWSTEHNLLAKRLYVVTSVPTDGLGPILPTSSHMWPTRPSWSATASCSPPGRCRMTPNRSGTGRACSSTGPPPAPTQ
jgi:hypothetical protein